MGLAAGCVVVFATAAPRNLQCILNLKRMVEEEVGKILAMENESLGALPLHDTMLRTRH